MFGAALLGAVVLLAALGGAVLWTRPLWMDEVAMFFLTSEATPAGMLRLIGQGGDWNPPTLHLVVWSLMRLVGMHAVTPIFLRVFSLVCVAFALVLLYAVLRRRFDRAAGIAGVLVVAAHTQVIEHAFEGRFYGPWLLCAVGFLFVLGVDAQLPRSRRRDVALATLSVLLVTIHWYGVFSLVLMCAGAVAAHGRQWRVGARLVAPALGGIVVLLALVPLALAQRASAAPVLWVQPLDLRQVQEMLTLFFPAALVVTLAALLVVSLFARSRMAEHDGTRTADVVLRHPSLAAMLALAAMPFVLMLLSVVFTPSMVYRYAIVSALAWAPVVALVASMVFRPARVALLGLLAVVLVLRTRDVVRDHRLFARVVGINALAFEQAKSMGIPTVFQRLQVMYAVAGTQRAPHTPARYLGLSDSIITALYPWPQADAVRASMRLDRDQALYHTRLFGWPVVTPLAAFDTIRRFALVTTDLALPPVYSTMDKYAARMFPRHRSTRVGPALTVFVRVDSARAGRAP